MTSADGPALIWTRPEPGTRRPKFTRDQIAATALAIADTEGFTAVSMRRVAKALDAGTMTLYYYVRTKDELVALMDDALMAQTLVPADELPAHWYEALTAVAERTWDVLLRHPWASWSPVGPNTLRHVEQSLAALAGTGLAPADKLALLTAVNEYVHGNALRATHLTGDDITTRLAFADTQVTTGQYPHTQALFGDRRPSEAYPALLGTARDSFRTGLDMLLTGAARRLNLG